MSSQDQKEKKDQTNQESKEAQRDGTSEGSGQKVIPYRVGGSGPPLVLLHGFGSRPHDWKKFFHSLSEHHQVIVPDLNSFYLDREFLSFDEQVEGLLRWFHDLCRQHGSLFLVGASYGGILAAALRARAPEIFSSVVLINPMPPQPMRRTDSRRLGWILRFARSTWLLSLFINSPLGRRTVDTLAESLRPDWKKRGQGFHFLLTRKQKFLIFLIHRFAQIMGSADWKKWEEQLSAQGPDILLIHSREDLIFGRQSVEWWQENLMDSECCEMSEGPHMVIRSHPIEVKKVIDDFFESTPLERKSS